jgi:hypothetical protein
MVNLYVGVAMETNLVLGPRKRRRGELISNAKRIDGSGQMERAKKHCHS